MRPFQIHTPATLSDAHSALLAGDAAIVAGGTDILGEMKEGIISPSALVSVGDLPELGGIEVSASGASIGGGVTLAEIAGSADIARLYPALAQAAASVATPQIRNVGTLGGNLCQRPRCWYYRSPLFDCLKKGGDTCFAVSGSSKYHAILGGDGCHIVHPSDPAVALAALNAEVEIFDGSGFRRLAIVDFFVGPSRNMLSETVLGHAEIVAGIVLPPPAADARSVYLKAKERRAYDFALASVGAYLEMDEGIVANARVALGGVSPVPHFAAEVSRALEGAAAGEIDAAGIGQLAVRHARPLSDNRYKVRLTANLVARALTILTSDEPPQ